MYKLASLSEQGWISDPKIILSYIMTSYMLTDASQSLVFEGNLKSLPETYYKHINDPTAMASAMSSELNVLLLAYFVHADVDAQAKQVNGKHHAIVLRASVMTEEGERVDLAKLMEIDTQNLRRIVNVNNYGDALSSLAQM